MSKEFKTLTIRDLDSEQNQDVVKIMNEVMSYHDLKTGQQVFEEVVRQYDYYKHYLSKEKSERKSDVDKLNARILELQQELNKYKKFHSAFSVLQSVHTEIIDSKN